MIDKPEDMFAPTMKAGNNGCKILFITANDTQDLEFFYPYYRFIEEGCKVDVATPNGGEFKGKAGMGLKETKKLSEVEESNYDLLYIPGGKAPAELKKNDRALEITREFADADKPIAAICHGGQVLAAANVIKGKNITAWPEVEKEITEAGGVFINKPAVVDGQFITARWPGDLPGHLAATFDALKTKLPQRKAS